MSISRSVVLSLLSAALSSQAQFTITPLSSFGSGGWLAPNGYNGSTYTYLTTSDTERGLAYGNNHLYLVSRNGGDFVRVLDPQTGADLGALNLGTGIVSGGTFDVNLIAVGGDGAIYVGNLATGPAAFRIYRWANDLSTTTPTVVYNAVPLAGARIGDSLAVDGSGSLTLLAAGFNNIPSVTGDNGYAIIAPNAGTATAVSFSTAPPQPGDFRLAITYTDSGHVIGTQGGTGTPVLYSSYSGATGTLLASTALASSDERPLSYAVVAGYPLMAAVGTGDSHVNLYDMTDPTQPILAGQANATTGGLASDAHSTGAVVWGKISGNSATLYAMATDQGIQAFTVTVPAPQPAAITSQPQSQIVTELFPASFSVAASGYPAPTLQWYRGSVLLSGATNTTYNIASAAYTDNGAQFKVLAQNVVNGTTYTVTSSVATLTVLADTNPPVLVSAQAVGLNQVQVTFSERVTVATATNIANYALGSSTASVAIVDAALDNSQTNVLLSVGALDNATSYTLTVNNISDQSHAANVIAANSQAQFLASVYALQPIGNPTPPGNQVAAGNGYDIAAGGSGIGGSTDQFGLSYQLRSGDFDLAVRIAALGLADPWTEAGLMAREDLSPGSRDASVLATPSISGAFFSSRSVTNSAAVRYGSQPVNYPNTWLRLKRSGSVFSGYSSFDGQTWSALGTASLPLASSIYFGFVVSSYNTNQLATASFRDFGPVTMVATNAAPSVERLSQCSRRTSLVISEIMYHPTNSSLEYIELFNSRGEPQDLSGYELAGSIEYTFPAGTSIAGGGFVVVGNSPAALQSAYNLSGVLGPYTNSLPNGNGTVRLLNQAGAVLLEVNYSDQPPWPVAADGAGHSLVLARPSYGENNVLAWAASDSVGGSPGTLDPAPSDPLRSVVINEFLGHTDLPLLDYIELYNHSSQPVDISGCILTDNPATNKFVIPAGTILPAHGFVSYTENQMNFRLSAAGETIYLKNPAQNRVLDAVRFSGQENGVATGRYPDGGEHFYRLSGLTPGAANAPIRPSSIVINEIMYGPISLNDDDQYVELYNRGSTAVDLSGWQFVSGISFTFPSNIVVQPEGYMVIARNASRMLTNYPNLNPNNLVGNFGGKLSRRGERLALAMPDTIVMTNSLGVTQTNRILITVNEVTYATGGRWGQWSDGGGSSLELIDPHADNTLAPNWADSDETHKAPWTVISATGTVDNGDVTADELQALIQGTGECLLDDVQVLDPNGNNRIANGTFESGSTGWTAEGTEKTSSLETTEGHGSSRSYHLRAVEKGDNQVNRVRTLLSSSLAPGTTNVTIRTAVRWLKGTPEVLLRLRGNWLECPGELQTPTNPGTPGARNSRYVGNTGPAIVDVKHAPVLPAASEPIVVRAQVTDPDGVAAVSLKYRLDSNSTYTTIPMTDDGTGGDAVAGDGIYTATIPGQASATLVAFYVQATDKASTTASFPIDAPTHECLVRVGEVQPTGNYPVYRLWMTQASFNTWNSNPKLDNSFNDVTFVLGDERVIYNAGARYKGSPYISPSYCGPTCSRCGYSFNIPSDDLFMGETELVIDWPGGHGYETTALQEQMCYWIADRMNLPWSHRHTIRLHINGVTDESRQATFEAVVQPTGSFVSEWYPQDTSGELFKIERAFEFNDSGGLMTDPEPRLQVYMTTGGVKKREHYRWNWMFRSTNRRDDYTNIFALVDAVNASAPEPYTSATLGLVDMEEWMGIMATEHIIVNFDAYGHEIGKNMYAYLPPTGRWQLYMFDLDWAMLPAPQHNSSYAPSTAPLFNSEDPTISRMYRFPPFARAYWRAIQNAVNGPLNPANCNPVMEAKSRSLFANGIKWCDGQALTGPAAVETWFSQRYTALQAQLATVAAPFAVTSIQVTNNVALINGNAPINVGSVWFNGGQWPLTWTTVTGWTATVALHPGTNSISVVGVDIHGQPIPGLSNNIAAIYNGTTLSPVGQVVINEIMYNPALPGAEYVELYNNSSSMSFDLSGWQLKGLSYIFPAGSLLGPNRYLVLAANRPSFAAAYGATNVVFDTYPGSLQNGGETLTLLQPGVNAGADLIVAKVRYRTTLPWPTQANGTGSSLQLIDSHQDNWRAGNWAASLRSNSNAPGAQWVYFTVTGTSSSSRLNIYLQSSGIGYVDDVKLVAGSVPEAGVNLVGGGDFESPLAASWNLGIDFELSSGVTNVSHSGSSSLQVASLGTGNSVGDAIYQDISPALNTGQVYTLSFWYLQTTNLGSPPLTVELSGSGLSSGTIYTTGTGVAQTFTPATPGAANGNTATLAPFPPLWINELQPQNLSGITNRLGQRTAWLELYNPSLNVVDLSGLYLSTNYGNLTVWTFPAGSTMSPGEFKVIFADGQPGLSVSNELHTGFVLNGGAGSLALSRLYKTQVQVLDYIDYSNLVPDHSYGSVPDGQSFDRKEFAFATPGAANNVTNVPSFIPYAGGVYTQNFDALPDPGPTSVNTANPVTINGVIYSLANPFDFALAPVSSGSTGGLGLSAMAGWYGRDSLTAKFGATDGDQTTGGVISFGPPANSVRALGLLATSSTGGTAFGAKFINQTGRSLNYINLQFTGELWRQSDLPKTIEFNYWIDPTASAPFSTNSTASIQALNIRFPTSATAVGGTAVDGTAAINQTSLTIANQPIASWSPGAALWLVWEMPDSTGKAQGLAIDNLTFSASEQSTTGSGPELNVQLSGQNLIFSWLSLSGRTYQVEFTDNLNSGSWVPMGGTIAGNGGLLTTSASVATDNQRFFRLALLP
jgi:hypothetical protein